MKESGIFVYISILILTVLSGAEPVGKFQPVDGMSVVGKFIDVNHKSGPARLFVRYKLTANSGVDVELISKSGEAIWRYFVEPLPNTDHSKYRQDVHVFLDENDKSVLQIISEATGGTISESVTLFDGVKISRFSSKRK